MRSMEAEYEVVKITSKGQMTLPKLIRDKLKLGQGSYLTVFLKGDEIVLKKINCPEPLSDDDPIWAMIGTVQTQEPDIAEKHDYYLVEGEFNK
jgi:transcriptional pleiotropic regulator of transition state genes